MRTLARFVLALFAVVLLSGSAYSSPPRHPGMTGVGENPQEGTASKQQIEAQAIQDLIQNAKDNLAFEKKWELDPLSRPKFNLISASDITKYRYTDRYLELGNTEVSNYFILQDDYVFRNLNGRFDKIPAGFIWDGASISKAVAFVALEVGNTRYNSAIAEGLIHDYMYRNPQRYTQREADELFYDNLKRCNNPDALKMYKGVDLFGAESYLRHLNNQQQGYYDAFTPEFYAENLKTFQGAKDSSLQKKQADMNSSNRNSPSDDWDCCKCANPEDRDFYCTKCGKISKGFAPHVDKEFEQMLKRRK